MNNDNLNPKNVYLIVLILLLFVIGLACDAVLGTADNPEEIVLTPAISTEVTTVEPNEIVPTPTNAPEDTAIVPTEFPSLADAVETFDNISAGHEENPVYPDTGAPPPGGPHNPVWQNCGVYTVPVEARNVLHSLEHGAVWLTYDPNLPEDDISILQELAKNQAYTVMSPYPGLRSAVVLTAWGVQFDTDSVNDPRILEFLLTYQQGEQTPEPGAPCQGGLGTPRDPDTIGITIG